MRFLKENWLGLLVVAVVLLAWFSLRSEATPFATLDDFDRIVASGQPAVVEFFSNG